ncbi:hypothetical protein DERP_010339 [Dermatophagoides pteronyssinus]|uniref:Uncharacterized protein n=1 Tax=Dermatophagoides pteronyssinus TaxID=6956 RepID=A0ABQ8IYV2_DERPT|nr:hypothetical protein DERP_010339 [Dermatophagoides pteronyssinus]
MKKFSKFENKKETKPKIYQPFRCSLSNNIISCANNILADAIIVILCSCTILRKQVMIISAEFESKPLVGSSIQIKFGIIIDVISIPNAKRLRSPFEHFCTILSAIFTINNSLRIRSAIAS